MKNEKIGYNLQIDLWRGDHAAPEQIDIQIWTDAAPWSETWIEKIVSRIWDLTMYDRLTIRTTLNGIMIRNLI